jgi:type VI secretion system protein ImpK
LNAVQLSRSNLLNKLRDFYALIVRLKLEIEEKGAEISVDRVQGELRSFIDTELRAQGADEANYQLFDAMRYVMVALADDAFLHMRTDWPGRTRWLSNILEKQYFGTQRAGATFFERIDDLLASRDKSKEEIATAFLLAILLGFKGRFRGDEEHELQGYRERLMYFVGVGQGGGLDAAKPIFPDAYAHTITNEPKNKLPDARPFYMLIAVVLVCFLGGSFWSWTSQTEGISVVATQIAQMHEVALEAKNQAHEADEESAPGED